MLALITAAITMIATASMTGTPTFTLLGIGNGVVVSCADNLAICNTCKSFGRLSLLFVSPFRKIFDTARLSWMQKSFAVRAFRSQPLQAERELATAEQSRSSLVFQS